MQLLSRRALAPTEHGGRRTRLARPRRSGRVTPLCGTRARRGDTERAAGRHLGSAAVAVAAARNDPVPDSALCGPGYGPSRLAAAAVGGDDIDDTPFATLLSAQIAEW